MIVGFWPTLLVGAVGALISEVIRVVPAFRRRGRLKARELVVSLIYVVIGGGAVLMGWNNPQSAFSVAVLGAAFPSLFSNALRAATTSAESRPTRSGAEGRGRSILDYAAGRF